MKRVLCPRCDGYVAFDERRCCAGYVRIAGKVFRFLMKKLFVSPIRPIAVRLSCWRIIVVSDRSSRLCLAIM